MPQIVIARVSYASAGGAVKRISWPSRFLDLPALLVDRHAHDVVYGRRGLGGLGRAEAEVIEDLGDGDLVVQVRDDLELAPTLRTREGIDVEHLRNEPRPTRGTAALLGGLLFNLNLGLSRFGGSVIAADAIGVVGVLCRVRDYAQLRRTVAGSSLRRKEMAH